MREINQIFRYTDINLYVGRVCVVCFTITTKIYQRDFVPESVASQHPSNSLKIKLKTWLGAVNNTWWEEWEGFVPKSVASHPLSSL